MRNLLPIQFMLLALLLVPAAVSCQSTAQQTRSSREGQMFVIPLAYASAHELATELSGLLRDPKDPSRAEPESNVLADERTNSLIVVLPAGANMSEADVRKLVSSLDVKVTR